MLTLHDWITTKMFPNLRPSITFRRKALAISANFLGQGDSYKVSTEHGAVMGINMQGFLFSKKDSLQMYVGQ